MDSKSFSFPFSVAVMGAATPTPLRSTSRTSCAVMSCWPVHRLLLSLSCDLSGKLREILTGVLHQLVHRSQLCQLAMDLAKDAAVFASGCDPSLSSLKTFLCCGLPCRLCSRFLEIIRDDITQVFHCRFESCVFVLQSAAATDVIRGGRVAVSRCVLLLLLLLLLQAPHIRQVLMLIFLLRLSSIPILFHWKRGGTYSVLQSPNQHWAKALSLHRL
mmetsp:Transcript_15416/g.25083  ORF Transcript_15416/g.25083 Transcript_15416/m.25083 type:complete len:216 (-) Transcript_15416:211-858(-)